jgi:hypothetical protein
MIHRIRSGGAHRLCRIVPCQYSAPLSGVPGRFVFALTNRLSLAEFSRVLVEECAEPLKPGNRTRI